MSSTIADSGTPQKKIRLTIGYIEYDKNVLCIYIPMSVSKQFKIFDVMLDELLMRNREFMQGALFPTKKWN